MKQKTMSAVNEKLSYTLGALFTVVALASFVELIYAIYVYTDTRTFRPSTIYIFSIYAFTQSMFFFLRVRVFFVCLFCLSYS